MTDEQRAEMRAAITEAVGAAFASLQNHLSEQLLELQADVSLALDKLDVMEIEMKDMQVQVVKIGGIEVDIKEVRVQVAKLSRELIKDRHRDELVAKRLIEIERRLTVQEAR